MGLIVILSSPSGAGKTTIARRLVAERSDAGFAISATTRPPRSGEHDGTDYYFVSNDAFTRRIAAGEFAEWAVYGGQRYGTPRSELARLREAGLHAVLDIDVQGARTLREAYPESVAIFILPPSAAALVERLAGRDTEPTAEVRRRLARAVDELEEAPTYDYVVTNDNLVEAVEAVARIIDSEARRPPNNAGIGAAVSTLIADLRAAVGPSSSDRRQE